MNRLTELDEYGNADIIGVDSEDLQLNLDFEGFNRVTEALNRLARYEDSGLAPDELEKLVAFKEYFDALYGQGLQIANWHMNGDLEPFDSFYEEAIADNEEEDHDGKNDQMEP